MLLDGWDATIKTLVSSVGQWDIIWGGIQGVWGSGLHYPPHRPGFAGLAQSTAAMSLRIFKERGKNYYII